VRDLAETGGSIGLPDGARMMVRAPRDAAVETAQRLVDMLPPGTFHRDVESAIRLGGIDGWTDLASGSLTIVAADGSTIAEVFGSLGDCLNVEIVGSALRDGAALVRRPEGA